MTGKTQFSAMVASSNTVEFGFPYGGEQHGRLRLRIHPQHGKDVQAGLDHGKPVRFAATGAADHSTHQRQIMQTVPDILLVATRRGTPPIDV